MSSRHAPWALEPTSPDKEDGVDLILLVSRILLLISSPPSSFPQPFRQGLPLPDAPSTITQYEYYSPVTPDDVRKIAGPPPRTGFLHTGFPGVGFSYVFLTIRL